MMATFMSTPIFISFASKDLSVARTICEALENRGFHCWISSRDIGPGENFQVAVVRAILDAADPGAAAAALVAAVADVAPNGR